MFAPGVTAAAAVIVAEVTFTNTISAGVIILSGIVALATVVGVIRGVRWKSAYEAEKALRETVEERVRGLAHERDDLQQQLEHATETVASAQATIARLEPLKDMGAVLEMVTRTFERLRDRQESMHVENKRDGDRRLQILLEEFRADRHAMLDEIRVDRSALIAELRADHAA